MNPEPAPRSLLGDILAGAVVLVVLVALAILTRLAEVQRYGDWDCLTKQCVIVPNGDGDASLLNP